MKRATRLIRHGGLITLPGRFTAEVVIVPRRDERDEIDADTYSEWRSEGCRHSIVIRASRSMKQRREDLEHELHHACVDWITHFLSKAK